MMKPEIRKGNSLEHAKKKVAKEAAKQQLAAYIKWLRGDVASKKRRIEWLEWQNAEKEPLDRSCSDLKVKSELVGKGVNYVRKSVMRSMQ